MAIRPLQSRCTATYPGNLHTILQIELFQERLPIANTFTRLSRYDGVSMSLRGDIELSIDPTKKIFVGSESVGSIASWNTLQHGSSLHDCMDEQYISDQQYQEAII